MEKLIGIYKIENKVTGQIYTGSSMTSIQSRWKYHVRDLKSNKHHSGKLQNSWNKYGENSFSFSILEICSKNDCLKREQLFLDTLEPFFNICKIAGNCIGRKVSEETKKKLSEISKKQGLNKYLLEQQKPKTVFNLKGEKFCIKCTEFKSIKDFQKRNTRTCKICFNQNRPSRKGLTGKLRDKPVIATCDFNELEFTHLNEAVRFFQDNGVSFNNKTLKIYIQSGEKYKGYYWSYK